MAIAHRLSTLTEMDPHRCSMDAVPLVGDRHPEALLSKGRGFMRGTWQAAVRFGFCGYEGPQNKAFAAQRLRGKPLRMTGIYNPSDLATLGADGIAFRPFILHDWTLPGEGG